MPEIQKLQLPTLHFITH